jgi:hypothetical protein
MGLGTESLHHGDTESRREILEKHGSGRAFFFARLAWWLEIFPLYPLNAFKGQIQSITQHGRLEGGVGTFALDKFFAVG